MGKSGDKVRQSGIVEKSYRSDSVGRRVAFSNSVDVSNYNDESSFTEESVTDEDDTYSHEYDSSENEELIDSDIKHGVYEYSDAEDSTEIIIKNEDTEKNLVRDDDNYADENEEAVMEVELVEEDESCCFDEEPSLIDEEMKLNSETVERESMNDKCLENSKDSSEEKEKPSVTLKLDKSVARCSDDGFIFRQEEYLGGSMPALYAREARRVKLRKSWITIGNDDERKELNDLQAEDFEDDNKVDKSYSNFFATPKVSRRKKDHGDTENQSKSQESLKYNPKTVMQRKGRKDELKMTDSPRKGTDATMMKKKGTVKRAKGMPAQLRSASTSSISNKTSTENNRANEVSPEMKVKEISSTAKISKKKRTEGTTTVNKVSPDKKAKETSRRPSKKTSIVSTTMSKVAKDDQFQKKDIISKQEMKRRLQYQKEVQGLKGQAVRLKRQLEVIPIEMRSQLADIEEIAARKMRDYSAKATHVDRKVRARAEKQTLKENAMKSQDLIEHLRNSNKSLREVGIKISKANQKLKDQNQLMEEANSFTIDYLTEFNGHHRAEIEIATGIQNQLNAEIPLYEELIRDMQASVDHRDRAGLVETKVKILYSTVMESMVEMVEDYCSNPDLVYTVAGIVNGKDTSVSPPSPFRMSTGSTCNISSARKLFRKTGRSSITTNHNILQDSSSVCTRLSSPSSVGTRLSSPRGRFSETKIQVSLSPRRISSTGKKKKAKIANKLGLVQSDDDGTECTWDNDSNSLDDLSVDSY